MYEISSPRAPRSSHHRSNSTTRTSPRQAQQDRVRPYGGHRGPQQPNYEQSQGAQTPLVAENLYEARDVFNVDPAEGVLEAGGETYQSPVAPAGRRRFVGGFVGGLRRALGRGRGDADADVAVDRFREEEAEAYREEAGGIAMPEPAVVHTDEREYAAVPAGEPVSPEKRYAASPEGRYAASPSGRYASPTPAGRYAASQDARNAAPSPEVRYATPTPQPQHATPGPDAQYRDSPERERHHRQESSSSMSETVHTTQEQYEGTTIVNHDMALAAQYASPEFVEPQLGPDYAKISPPHSEASLGSYVSRIHRFFQTVNSLPWIAPDRVTVDYIPGKARRDQLGAGLTARPHGGRRAIISWYNSNIPQGSIDLLSGSSSPLTEFAQARPIAMASPPPPAALIAAPVARYPDVAFANNMPVPMAAAGPPPMARSAASGNRPRRVPVPAVDEEELEPGQDGGAYYAPRYPNGGYVPYDQQPAPMAQTYTGSSVGSSLRAPRQ
ncbi:hypothetical protein FB451DRAFT_518878 [Mycena latifolia]|nr:hypothetical protein FB451DRAFT_518878 [Mycena latifolia]